MLFFVLYFLFVPSLSLSLSLSPRVHSRHRSDLLVLERHAADIIPVAVVAARAAAAAAHREIRVAAPVAAPPRRERLGPRDRRGEALGRLRAQPEGAELAALLVGGGGCGGPGRVEAGGADDAAEDRSGGPVWKEEEEEGWGGISKGERKESKD